MKFTSSLLIILCLDKPETTSTGEVHSDRSTSGEEQSQAESKEEEEEVESEEGEKEVAAEQERKEVKKEGDVTGKQEKKAGGTPPTASPKGGVKKRRGNTAEQKSGVPDNSNAGETEPAEEPGWSTVTGRKQKVSVVTSLSMA